jgi:N-acetylmuramoyl-L-alanine amidase
LDPSTPRLRRGDTGELVQSLHVLLVNAGHPLDPRGDCFDERTEAAVREFQASRGLQADGVCGAQTWGALHEARYRLGDRLLYLQRPMLRGDDVADLQRRLGALGFDPGRVDGIFGPDSAAALTEFQRNTGLTADGIAGPDSITALRRLGGRDAGTTISSVRERETLLQRPRTLNDAAIVVGEFGGADAAVSMISRRLRAHGARVDALHHPDVHYHARTANGLRADLYLGLSLLDTAGCTLAYFATEGFESPGGRQFACLLARHLEPLTSQAVHHPAPPEITGMRLPVLRETRMPAVLLRLGPPQLVTERAEELADAIAGAAAAWSREPVST